MTEEAIDEMMQSFRLENCVPREPLISLLRAARLLVPNKDSITCLLESADTGR